MKENKPSDFLWKVVLCGDSFVGKTTIRKRAMGEHFAEEYISTVGADFSSYKLKMNDLTIGFQIWDLAGQDKYKYIRSSFYGGATGCFLVFDVTNPKSLTNLANWVDEAIRYSNGTIEIFIICANKIDLKNKRQVSKDTIEKYTMALRESSGLQCEYIETSALTGENINTAFDKMAKCLLEREGIKITQTTDDIESEESITKTTKIAKSKKEATPPTITFQNKTTEKKTPQKKTVMIDNSDGEETERLIAEVMDVLGEEEELIIGRESTKNGERAITVPKESLVSDEVILDDKEDKPEVAPELEQILGQITTKLDSLNERLKGLEEEIINAKIEEDVAAEIDHYEEPASSDNKEIAELFEEEIALTELETEDEEEAEESDPLIDLEPDMDASSAKTISQKEAMEKIEKHTPLDSKTIATENTNQVWSEDQELLESLVDSQDESIDFTPPIVQEDQTAVEEELDAPALEKDKDDLLDELLIEENTTEFESENLSKSENKSVTPKNCPVCNEELKYIRQYNRYYCKKCGRYV
jgi:small GTP-binding protein